MLRGVWQSLGSTSPTPRAAGCVLGCRETKTVGLSSQTWEAEKQPGQHRERITTKLAKEIMKPLPRVSMETGVMRHEHLRPPLMSPPEAARMPGPGSHSPGESVRPAHTEHRPASRSRGGTSKGAGGGPFSCWEPTDSTRGRGEAEGPPSGKKGTEVKHRNEEPSLGRSGNPINLKRKLVWFLPFL